MNYRSNQINLPTFFGEINDSLVLSPETEILLAALTKFAIRAISDQEDELLGSS